MRVDVVGEAFSVEYEKLNTDRFRVNAFLQGQFPGATSPKGPAAQARAVFGGALPHGSPCAACLPGVQPGSLTHCWAMS